MLAQDGRLLSQAAGQRVVSLRFQADHVGVRDCHDTARVVLTIGDGRATPVTLHEEGAMCPGDRLP